MNDENSSLPVERKWKGVCIGGPWAGRLVTNADSTLRVPVAPTFAAQAAAGPQRVEYKHDLLRLGKHCIGVWILRDATALWSLVETYQYVNELRNEPEKQRLDQLQTTLDITNQIPESAFINITHDGKNGD